MLDREVFGALLLDARQRLIKRLDLFYGTINQAVVASAKPRASPSNVMQSLSA